jgi:hypothetical protein
MKKQTGLLAQIPFVGLYESLYSGGIDQEESQWCEYEAQERETEWPEALRLDESELAEIVMDASDYKKSDLALAQSYLDAYEIVFEEVTGLALQATFDAIESPKFYNFETDRIFAYIPRTVARAMFAMHKRDKFATLTQEIAARHTSCSGFSSFYSCTLEGEWCKPVIEWDHNQLCTLLRATVALHHDCSDLDSDLAVYYELADCDGFLHEWEAAVDWTKLESAKLSARRDKFDALNAIPAGLTYEQAQELGLNGGETLPNGRVVPCPLTIPMAL